MDKKDRRVDDILDDIKRRKAREKKSQLKKDVRLEQLPAEDFLVGGDKPPVEVEAIREPAPSVLEDASRAMKVTINPEGDHEVAVREYSKKPFSVAPTEIDEDEAGTAPAHNENPENTRKIIDFSLYRPQVDNDPDYRRSQPRDIGHLAAPSAEDFLEDEYASEEFEDEAPPAVDMGEFNRIEDRGAVSRDLAKVKQFLRVRTMLTALLATALVYITFAGAHPLPLPASIFPEDNISAFLAVFAALGILVALVCNASVGGGIIGLFKLRPNSDTLASLALLAAIGQSVVALINPESIDINEMNLFIAIAAMIMFFGCISKIYLLSRIQANFRVAAGSAQKKAAMPVNSRRFCEAFVPISIHETRSPVVVNSLKADFYTDFLAHSYSENHHTKHISVTAYAGLALAVVVGGLSYLIAGNMFGAFSVLAAILCVAATFSVGFIENIPLFDIAKKVTPYGGMVSGNKAVKDFCDTRAVILGEKDIFPMGCLVIHGIKAYHGRIDEAILDAASVICATDSALGSVFLDMIGGDKSMLKKADNIVCEDEQGISAWVGKQRILIGNRQMMASHGIAPPPQVLVDDGRAQGDVLYLSNSGDVTAQFTVGYSIDEDLALELDQMAARGVMLIVHTMIPNITPQKIFSLYGYPAELVRIMPASMHKAYEQMTAPKETAPAGIVYSGGSWVMLRAIRACMGARTAFLTASIIQICQIVLGCLMVSFIVLMGAGNSLNILHIAAYQGFWLLGILIVQRLRS